MDELKDITGLTQQITGNKQKEMEIRSSSEE